MEGWDHPQLKGGGWGRVRRPQTGISPLTVPAAPSMVPIHLKRLSDSGKAEMPLSPDICGGSALGRPRTPPPPHPASVPGAFGDPQLPAWSQDPQTTTRPRGPTHHQRHQFLLQPAGKAHVTGRLTGAAPALSPAPGPAHLLPTAPRAAVAPVSAALRAAALDTAAGSAFCEAIAAPGARTSTPALAAAAGGSRAGRDSRSLAAPHRAPLAPSLPPAVPLGAGLGPSAALSVPSGVQGSPSGAAPCRTAVPGTLPCSGGGPIQIPVPDALRFRSASVPIPLSVQERLAPNPSPAQERLGSSPGPGHSGKPVPRGPARSRAPFEYFRVRPLHQSARSPVRAGQSPPAEDAAPTVTASGC